MLAIARAQKKLRHSNIAVPVLVMHSAHSNKLSTFVEEAMSTDIVLNVEDIKRIGSRLGKRVTLLEFENAQHDIFLSSKEARDRAFGQVFAWLEADEGRPGVRNTR